MTCLVLRQSDVVDWPGSWFGAWLVSGLLKPVTTAMQHCRVAVQCLLICAQLAVVVANKCGHDQSSVTSGKANASACVLAH